MKAMRVVVATCAVLAGISSGAQASLILVGGTPTNSFVDLGGQGFGAAPRLLTMQGPVPPSAHSADFEIGNETPIDVENGDAIDGANKSSTPTLGTLGWTSGAQVGIGFNSSQSGNTGITLQTLTLTLYNGTTAVGSFSLAAPITFSGADLALQQGNGNAVFNFGLDLAQQAQFNTLLATHGSGLYAGVGAFLGCDGSGDPAGCLVANDGPDSFLGFAQSAASVPDGGSTVTLLGSVLLAFGMLRRKLRT